MKRILPLLLAVLLPTAAAEIQRVGSTNVYYSYETDAMTDANDSYIAVGEINDTSASTVFLIYCREGQAEFYLKTKNTLLSADDYDMERTPNLMYRVDAQQAKTIPTDTVSKGGEPDYTALAFDTARTQILLTAFNNAQQKIVFRILRNDASALDYTFSTKGFKEAWRAVKNCK
ncbi:hypothetical protein GCM10008959_32680 [Deinococcus seoulensis]|uniref:Uncharacterized protein n=1 Tax=Deinococcus seoulensis TaxID=1837379 RepID=A0ABQ2RYA0_9DEIO|nr:hypothetical protein [Deinococcus seoulensis]GGR68064.1 hypothetical protein GCM10008959_32680 [Deinococcus seoulensis]